MVHKVLLFKDLGGLKTPGSCKVMVLSASMEGVWAGPARCQDVSLTGRPYQGFQWGAG